MRSAALVAILVASAALLAGCSSKSNDATHVFVCKNSTSTVTIDLTKFPGYQNSTFSAASHCPGAAHSATNTTSQAPNVLPILQLAIKDKGGNKTNVTMLDGNLTFDATGSHDPDGTVTGIAVTVQDSNQTRTAALFDPVKKAFKTATFKFDRPGVVNVTVAMVDDRAGFTINQTHVYVDQTQVFPPFGLTFPDPADKPTDCQGPSSKNAGSPLGDSQFSYEFLFNVVAGATKVDATATVSSARIAICTPHPAGGGPGTPVSAEATGSVSTDPGVALPPPKGVSDYFVETFLGNSDPHESVGMTVVVHYEPQKAK